MTQDPDILVDLTDAITDFEAEVIVEALRNQGIHAEAFTSAGAMIPIAAIATHPYRVAVRRGDLERAKEALRAIKADSVDLDWDEVDTGQPEKEAEPSAGLNPWVIVGIVAGVVLLLVAVYLLQIGILPVK